MMHEQMVTKEAEDTTGIGISGSFFFARDLLTGGVVDHFENSLVLLGEEVAVVCLLFG